MQLLPSLTLSYFLLSADPAHIKVGSAELSANHDVKQVIEICEYFDKRRLLVEHLEGIAKYQGKAIIFVATKRTADEITLYLRKECVCL